MNDSTFRELGADQSGTCGPRAVLLCGYSPEDAKEVEALLDRIGEGDASVRLCTEAMLTSSLKNALESGSKEPPVAPDRLPRVMVLSGLTDARIRAILKDFAGTGLSRPIFCAATPENLTFTVRQLLRELMAEHIAMQKMRRQQQKQ